MHLYGKDWRRVEAHIGTRNGAQIRSHAQKFFNRLQHDANVDPDAYIREKATMISAKRGTVEAPLPIGETSLSKLVEKEALQLEGAVHDVVDSGLYP